MSQSIAAVVPEELPAPVGAVPALLAFNSNRAPFVSSHKAAGMFRIAVVGDSMTFGQGLPHSRTMSQRLAAHLNGALPGQCVEGVSLGMCGACLFHALERVEDQAMALAPDVLIVAVCCNDAYMLRRQPLTNEAIGETWVEFRPQLEHALATFADRMRHQPFPTALLYFDRSPVYGSVSPAAILRDVCNRVGLPFVDGSDALTAYQPDAITISEADGHLNALANDIVARHLVRALGDLGWLPPAGSFSDPHWLEALRGLPQRLEQAGVPSLLAATRAVDLLDVKWADRRNRVRSATTAAYQRIRADLVARQIQEGRVLVWGAAGRWLHERHRSEGALAFAEARLHELAVLVSALEFATVHGGVQQNLEEIEHIIGPGDAVLGDAEAIRSAIQPRIQNALATMQSLRSVLPLDRERVSPDLRAIDTLSARVGGLLRQLERVAQRLLHVWPSAAASESVDTLRVLAYAERAVREGCERLAAWAEQMPWQRIADAARAWQVPQTMRLELVIAADPGPETWPLGIAVESLYPFYQEVFLHADNLIRDGKPHAYVAELPISLLGDIYLHFGNIPVEQTEEPGPLRVFPATLTAAGLPPKSMPRLQFANRTATGATFAYRAVFLLEESR